MDAIENQPSGDGPWTIFILTCRRPEIDFRLPIAKALAALGHEVNYIFLKRHPVYTRFADGAQITEPISLLKLTAKMRYGLRTAPRAFVLNSTNLAFPGLCSALRIAVGGLWCLDLHDDLLYEKKGLRRLYAEKAQSLLVLNSDLMIHAAPTLVELFPKSIHLGNASSITPIQRVSFVTERVLVLASLDGRFDFQFLSSAAELCPEISFDIFGHVSVPSIRVRLDELLAEHKNVKYAGPYDNIMLPEILSNYSITLAPYQTQSILTKYIDPLRYYHCLNSGMEVISTNIPPAQELQDHLHVVKSPEDFRQLVASLRSSPASRKNNRGTYELFNWNSKAIRLIEIVKDFERCLRRPNIANKHQERH